MSAVKSRRVRFRFDDGGRGAAGFYPHLPPALRAPGKEEPGDCAVRAVSIALGLPYRLMWEEFVREMRRDEFCQRWRLSDPEGGVPPHITDDCLQTMGWRFVLNEQHVTMHDLPPGRYVLEFREKHPAQATLEGRSAGHLAALVDGELRDIVDNTDSHMWGWYWPKWVRHKDGSPAQLEATFGGE